MTEPETTSGLGHDPGGRVRLPLKDGIVGAATFSPCGRYRHLLGRTTGLDNQRTALWIGANPSTADANVDDPTVQRETGFTRRFGYGRYLKTNILDYRATRPRDLLAETVVTVRSAGNLQTIVEAARQCDLIVLAYGALHRRLRHYADETLGALEEAGCETWCLGMTSEGFPKHPLYLSSNTPLIRFAGPAKRRAE